MAIVAENKSRVKIGQRFGMLVVLGRSFHATARRTAKFVVCQCDCGNVSVHYESTVFVGQAKSCGCLQKKLAAIRASTHGGTYTRLFRIWAGMIQRCTNPNVDSWQYYGGKGIRVCDEWKSFEDFKRWALGNGYGETLTIERDNNDLNYCPQNCRWIPPQEQSKNRSRRKNRATLDGALPATNHKK